MSSPAPILRSYGRSRLLRCCSRSRCCHRSRHPTRHASTLTAISMAAVYCGALTYIGNAPNLMVRSIAEERGVRMPSFFAYFGWTLLLMAVPLAVIVALL
jgi:Na+/H+ antiporter NhaD/arsenite permease-like protein